MTYIARKEYEPHKTPLKLCLVITENTLVEGGDTLVLEEVKMADNHHGPNLAEVSTSISLISLNEIEEKQQLFKDEH